MSTRPTRHTHGEWLVTQACSFTHQEPSARGEHVRGHGLCVLQGRHGPRTPCARAPSAPKSPGTERLAENRPTPTNLPKSIWAMAADHETCNDDGPAGIQGHMMWPRLQVKSVLARARLNAPKLPSIIGHLQGLLLELLHVVFHCCGLGHGKLMQEQSGMSANLNVNKHGTTVHVHGTRTHNTTDNCAVHAHHVTSCACKQTWHH
jgi:hypothetical protein